MRRFVSVLLSLALISSFVPSALAAKYAPGTYTGEGQGFGGKIKVAVTVSSDRIEKVEITENSETPGIGTPAIEKLPTKIVESQSAKVDVITAATETSNGIIEAVDNALKSAELESDTPASLPQLASPSPYWGDSYQTCWKVNKPTQGRYRYLLYRTGNDNPVLRMTTGHDSSDNTCVHNYFTVNIENLEDGTYYFTVESLGDGINYMTSKPSVSEELIYVRPSQVLQPAMNIKWNFPHITWTQSPDEDHVLFYIANFYFSKTKDGTPQFISSGFNASVGLRDEVLQKYGDGYYYAAIYGISDDVLLYQNTPLSQLSPAYHFTTTSTAENLSNILTDESITNVRAAVQGLNTADLKSAILADPGETGGATDILRQLEAKTGVDVAVNAAAGFEFLSQTDIVGAALNDVPEGAATITLNITAPKREHVLPEQYSNTVALHFSMGLEGVANQEALKVPVKVTLPISPTINPAFLEILHYNQSGKPEVIELPYKFQKDGKWFVSIVLTHFSDFVMTELKQEKPVPDPTPSHPSNSNSGGGSSSTYSVATKAEHGTVSAQPKRAERGEKVTVTVSPSEEYILSSLVVKDRNGKTSELSKVKEGSYTFLMPSSKVTVEAVFEEAPVEPHIKTTPVTELFHDVAATDSFLDSVQYVYDNGIMQGFGKQRFAPEAITTRATIVTMLYRIEGEPAAAGSTFPDVKAGCWYSQAVAWGADTEIVNGFEDGTFRPEDHVTQEQLLTILYRYAKYKGFDIVASKTTNISCSKYSMQPIQWAFSKELITTGEFSASKPVSRSKTAVLMTGFCKSFPTKK